MIRVDFNPKNKESKEMKCYIPGYPRPQFVRKSWENLNGKWDFAFDDKNEGLSQAWYAGSFPAGKEILVPFCYECPASEIGDPSRHDVVWYRRRFSYQKKTGSRRLLLHFEGCDYQTDVWINGVHAGSHIGGYARFSFDISHLTKEGENEIVVRAADSFSLTQPRGKQRWKDENFGCWYVQTTGIWKTVWLEQVSDVYLEAVKMTPVMSGGRLEIEAIIAGAEHFSPSLLGELEIEAEISFHDKPVSRTVVTPNAKQTVFSAQVASLDVSEWALMRWSPENPALYDIRFSLKQNDKIIDEALSYFGMREIRIEGSQVILNNEPLYQRLILDQGYWKDSHLTPPNEEALVKDIDSVMAAGYNGVRKHQKTEDELFLYWSDV
jgi:beta-galactosidase/beta-glucuronidase